uniref:RING-type domain-containing protein n=1 Tax=Glossina pallidipes TaxID=7398 RepID=A0A1B0ABR2_GLOPL
MELSPGAFCSICVECFTASDSIYSIACGHVFHAQCIKNWKLQSRNCPECRRPFHSMERVFLNVEDDSKIQSHANELKKLRNELHESEKKFANMQKQYTVSEEKVRELKKLRDKLHESEKKFVNMQKQYTASKETVRKLEKQVENVKRNEEALRKKKESKQKENSDMPETCYRMCGDMKTCTLVQDQLGPHLYEDYSDMRTIVEIQDQLLPDPYLDPYLENIEWHYNVVQNVLFRKQPSFIPRNLCAGSIEKQAD